MAYATVAQLREMLTQVAAGAVNDALLQTVLDEATDIVDGRLGFSFAAFGVASDRDFLLETASQFLTLPRFQAATLTKIYELSAKGTSYEGTVEVLATEYDVLPDGRLYRYTGWPAGWYRATASWGYGAAPVALVRVVKEIAVNLWGARDARQITDQVGVEGGGAVRNQTYLTGRQKMIIDDVRTRYDQWGFA